MKDLLKLSLVCLLTATVSAHAAKAKKSAKKETTPAVEAAPAAAVAATPAVAPAAPSEEDADNIITNKKLRADTGSKSKYSIKTLINYSGSTLEKPFDKSRPNITAGTQNTNFATLGGTVSGKWNLSARNSLQLGGGVRWLTPFEGSAPTASNGKKLQKFDIFDPSVTFQRIGKLGNVQSVTQLSPTLITRSDKREQGHQTSTDLSQIFAYELGATGLTLGGLVAFSFRTFDKNDMASRAAQADFGLGAYPFLEYTINDRFNLRTISGLWVYERNRTAESWTFEKNTIYQSVGLGISVTRDIYLYPNVQFIPEYMRNDRTNVALNTSINLF